MHLPPVLIVEDDPDARNMLAALLGLHGYRSVLASNGAEALELARRERPGVILLDLMMPVMDGQTFRQEQLNDSTIAAVPVIVLSAHARTPELAQTLGAAAYLLKPFDLEQLLDVIRTAQNGRHD